MPKMDEEILFYLDAFFLLSSSRSSGMSVGTIPLSEITNYSLFFDIIDDLRTFCNVIQAMDGVYIEYVSSQNSKPNKPSTGRKR